MTQQMTQEIIDEKVEKMQFSEKADVSAHNAEIQLGVEKTNIEVSMNRQEMLVALLTKYMEESNLSANQVALISFLEGDTVAFAYTPLANLLPQNAELDVTGTEQ